MSTPRTSSEPIIPMRMAKDHFLLLLLAPLLRVEQMACTRPCVAVCSLLYPRDTLPDAQRAQLGAGRSQELWESQPAEASASDAPPARLPPSKGQDFVVGTIM